MGDMADMLIEQSIEWDSMEHWYCSRPSKVLQCSACRKRNLKWHNVKGYWVMFEPDGSRLHTCEGYTPHLTVLKELAKININLARMNDLDKLYHRMMKAGGFKKIVNIVTSAQLLDLFIRVTNEHGVEPDDVGNGRKTDYSKQLSQIRTEILRRMTK